MRRATLDAIQRWYGFQVFCSFSVSTHKHNLLVTRLIVFVCCFSVDRRLIVDTCGVLEMDKSSIDWSSSQNKLRNAPAPFREMIVPVGVDGSNYERKVQVWLDMLPTASPHDGRWLNCIRHDLLRHALETLPQIHRGVVISAERKRLFHALSFLGGIDIIKKELILMRKLDFREALGTDRELSMQSFEMTLRSITTMATQDVPIISWMDFPSIRDHFEHVYMTYLRTFIRTNVDWMSGKENVMEMLWTVLETLASFRKSILEEIIKCRDGDYLIEELELIEVTIEPVLNMFVPSIDTRMIGSAVKGIDFRHDCRHRKEYMDVLKVDFWFGK
jgi:hypothetical protein